MVRTAITAAVLLGAWPSCGGATASDAPGGRGDTGNTPSAGASATAVSPGASGATWGVGGALVGESGGATQSNAGGAPPAATGGSGPSESAPPCGPLVDDMENGTGWILRCDGRRGAWYAFGDGHGIQSPAPTPAGVAIAPALVSKAREGSLRGMATTTTCQTAECSAFDPANTWGAGIGFDFLYDGQSYGHHDASAYRGIAFWARSIPDVLLETRVGTVATTLREYGGSCAAESCDPHHVTVKLSSGWTQYAVPFTSLLQYGIQGGRSSPVTVGRSEFNQTELTNLQFLVRTPNLALDHELWVDDVSFYSEPPANSSVLPPDGSGLPAGALPMNAVGFIPRDSNSFGIQGSWYWYSDSDPGHDGKTVLTGATRNAPPFVWGKGMCLTGSSPGGSSDGFVTWGAGIGVNLNQEPGSPQATLLPEPPSCFTITLTSSSPYVSGAPGGLRAKLVLDPLAIDVEAPGKDLIVGTNEVCIKDVAPPGWCTYGSPRCPTSASLAGGFASLQVQALSGNSGGTIDFCISSIVPHP